MLKTRITDLFGIEHPVIQRNAMGRICRIGLCSIKCRSTRNLDCSYSATPEDLTKEIARTREMTDKPFGVNLTILQQ